MKIQLFECKTCKKTYKKKKNLTAHEQKEVCKKYDEILHFATSNEYTIWKNSLPKYFGKINGTKIFKNHESEILYCNNKRYIVKDDDRSPNWNGFLKSNIRSCNGKIKAILRTDGSATVFINKCTNSQHVVPEALPLKIKQAIIRMLHDGLTNSQIKTRIVKKFKTFVSRYSINNLQYKTRINMEYRTSDCDIISTTNFLQKFENVKTNIKEIASMKNLIAVFQTKEMHDLWNEADILCIDSTHKITK